MSYDAQRLASQRPTTVTHEVQASYDSESQQVFAQSQNYQTRVTRGTPVRTCPPFERITNCFGPELEVDGRSD
jgi:hypothetical protein